jgi:arsenite methyltransferase
MSSLLQFDEEASRRVDAVYRTPDVVAQRRDVVRLLAPARGERILDIGSGPGMLACELAEAVGPDGAVDGVDPSESMLAIARRREPAPGAGPVRYAAADACALPFDAGTFDAAVCTQVYEYVEDMPAALAEARRVLRDGGRLLVLDTDWDSIVWHSSDPERMRRVLAAW